MTNSSATWPPAAALSGSSCPTSSVSNVPRIEVVEGQTDRGRPSGVEHQRHACDERLTGGCREHRCAGGVVQGETHDPHGRIGGDPVVCLRHRQGVGAADHPLVSADDVMCRSHRRHASAVDQDGAIRQLLDRAQIVRHQDHRRPTLLELLDPPHASCLELGVAHRQHLVDEKDVGLEMCGDREPQAHVHPRRVVLDRRVEERGDA